MIIVSCNAKGHFIPLLLCDLETMAVKRRRGKPAERAGCIGKDLRASHDPS